jgi:tRNA threonylcarbamoyl adenosine modification protein YeaZ
LLILSIDSSQPVGSVTLARADEHGFKVIETVEAHGGKFSAQLIPTVKRLFEAHAVSKQDIDVIAAASGPGTFTGLRVGLAAVKALAETLGKPIVTVSVLEALAQEYRPALAISEASRGQWYAGFYSSESQEERHCTQEQLLAFIRRYAGAKLVTNGSLPPELRDGARHIATPVSELVARIAAMKAARHEFVEIDALDANYVRPDESLYQTS